MLHQKASGPAGLPTGQGHNDGTTGSAQFTTGKPRKKWVRVATALVDGHTLNRFDALRQCRDSCLNTTISDLKKKGLVIVGEEEVIPGYAGVPTYVKRYKLDPQSLGRARALLAAETGEAT